MGGGGGRWEGRGGEGEGARLLILLNRNNHFADAVSLGVFVSCLLKIYRSPRCLVMLFPSTVAVGSVSYL